MQFASIPKKSAKTGVFCKSTNTVFFSNVLATYSVDLLQQQDGDDAEVIVQGIDRKGTIVSFENPGHFLQQRIFALGSLFSKHLFAISEYDTQMQKWEPFYSANQAPNCRLGCSFFVRKNGTIVMFGGKTNQVKNDFVTFDIFTRKWNTILQDVVARCAFAYAYHAASDCMYVHGGTQNGTNRLNDLQCYDFATNKWQEVQVHSSVQPPATAAHMMVFHDANTLFLFNDGVLFRFCIVAKQWNMCLQMDAICGPILFLSNEQSHLFLITENNPNYVVLLPFEAMKHTNTQQNMYHFLRKNNNRIILTDCTIYLK